MKKLVVIICLVILLCLSAYAYFLLKYEDLYPINDKTGGGYINKYGIVRIEQKYNFAGRFEGNYAIVQGKNLKEGIIDKQGNTVIDFQYDFLNDLSENFAIYKANGKYGFIDIKNNTKSQALYDNIKKFKEGLAAVCIDGKWGFIDKNGVLIIKPEYYDVSNFSEGLAAVSYSDHKTAGYINKKGEMVISFEDNNLNPKEFHEGLAPVIKEKDKACSYINKKGEIVIDNKKIYPINIYCGNFYEGLTVFYIDNNPKEITTGYIDKKGTIKYSMLFSIPSDVSEGEFSAFNDFSFNMAQFTIDYKTGYINRKFKMVIPAIYEFARDFNKDLAYVKFEDKEGYINTKGYWVWSKEREGM